MSTHCPPILIVYFNRPAVLRQNLKALSSIAPKQLFFACDAPRPGVETDKLRVEECQKLVRETVIWDCTVESLFADRNYGCDEWVPLAITWFFSKVQAGIILEDDCIIDVGFARFAFELLEKYKNEPRMMNISAANFQNRTWGDGDYYFSLYPANWAWASWARAWAAYDAKLERVKEFIESSEGLTRCVRDTAQRKYWKRFYRLLSCGKYTFWDAKWLLSMWCNQGISITPNGNLVRNIGFGNDATHTNGKSDVHNMAIVILPEILTHPVTEDVNSDADQFLFKMRYKLRFVPCLKALVVRLLGINR
jgi:hypothetical protein